MSIGVASCYSLLIPLTLLGNGWVIIAFVTNSKLRTATNIFIAGLASSDLLVGVFSIPVWTFISAHENIAVVGYCLSLYAVYISLDIFAGCASILQLTAISIERFISVQWPMTHRKMPLLVYCFMLLFAWLCATIMAALQPLQTEAWRHIYTVVLFVACFFCPLVIVCVCYFYIFKISHFQAKPRRSSSSARCGTPGGTIKERKVVITVAVITGLFLIAWLPFFVVTVIATFCLPCLPAPPGLFHLVKVLKLLQYSSSAVNPYIYAYRNAEMRQAFRKITRNFVFCRRFRSTRVITRNSQQSTSRLQDREPHYHSISKNNSSFGKENFVVDIRPVKTFSRGKTLKNVKTKTAVVYL